MHTNNFPHIFTEKYKKPILSKKNNQLAIAIAFLFLGMLALAFAFVPLYNIFCKVTGYGGATQRAIKISNNIGEKRIKVRFDANIEKNLDWEFVPLQNEVEVVTGENALVFYKAKNLSDQPIIGTAVYNVTPFKAGIYFNKIQCFCFQEQLLQPGQEVMMPVSFFVDPEFDQDKNMEYVDTITLSYRFYKVKNSPK